MKKRVNKGNNKITEWVCACCLTPLWNSCSYIMTRTSYIFDEMIMMCALLDLVLVYWSNSPWVGMSNALAHYSYSEPTSLWSFSLEMRDLQRSNTHQLNSLWFDPTEVRTHDIPHLTITPPLCFMKKWE